MLGGCSSGKFVGIIFHASSFSFHHSINFFAVARPQTVIPKCGCTPWRTLPAGRSGVNSCPVSLLFDVSSQIFRVSRIRSFSNSLVVSQLCRTRVEIGDSWNKNMYIERASHLCFLLSHLSDQLHNLTYSLMKFSLDLLTMASDFAF